MISALLLAFSAASALAADTCATPEATAAFQEGYTAQQEMRSDAAVAAYDKCLKLDPKCVPCQYEVGWSYWAQSDFPAAATAWERTLTLDPAHEPAKAWLAKAKSGGSVSGAVVEGGVRVPMGTKSRPGDAPVQLELVGRFQNYRSKTESPADVYDTDINSPKSARFLPDGSKVYVNSLEGYETVVYDPKALKKAGVIDHHFDKADAPLFHGESTVFGYAYHQQSKTGDPNVFGGKPVETEFSHGRWMWVPYYRRDFDNGSTSPSAVSVVDAKTDQVVRVFPTGPIPKYVAASPDGKFVVVTHWGDNTLGVIDTSSPDPQKWAYLPERLVVERVLPQEGLIGTDRDSTCGHCLRGTVFTPDSKTLLVARMGSGGIAAFDVATWKFLGTVTGEEPTPRHLVISPDGKWLYLTSNRTGSLGRIPLETALAGLRSAGGKKITIEGWDSLDVGNGARTLDVTPDGKYLFVAVNGDADIAVVDAATWKVVSKVRTDSYTVGLAVSPDGKQVWTTSQGKGTTGGNSVCVYAVRYPGAGK